MARDVRAGLTSEPKTLPPKYFYDARGSELALRKTSIQPQALEPLPDRLARGRRKVGLHFMRVVVGCHRCVKRFPLTTSLELAPFVSTPRAPSFEGAHPRPQGGQMSGKSLYVKLVLLMLVLGTLSLVLGGEPWGPN